VSRRNPGNQSGQIVLLGVFALLLLGVSIGASLYQIGAKSTVRQQQVAATGSTELVKKAITAFVARNYRLPCPADGSLAQGNVNDGVEQGGNGTACTITDSSGVVPWKTIGLNYSDVLDGWQHRFAYAVSAGLVGTAAQPTPYKTMSINSTGATTASGASNNLVSYETIQVASCTPTCGTAAKYGYVLVSFGKDGAGAYLLSGTRTSVSGLTGTNELANTTSAAFSGSGSFQVYPSNVASTAGTSYYDDLVVSVGSSEICGALNGTLATDPSKPYCNPSNNNPNGDGTLSTNNTFSGGTTGTGYNGHTVNGGSLANSLAFSNCSGTFCSGTQMTIKNGLGNVTLTDSNGNAKTLSTGNPNIGTYGDWIGGDDTTVCTRCPFADLNPAYIVPNETLRYTLTYSYTSFAFVDFMINGGTTITVTGKSGDPTDGNTWVTVGTLTLSNGNVTKPACLGPDNATAPLWYQTLYAASTISAHDNGFSYPPPQYSTQWPQVAAGTTSLVTFTDMFDNQFANRLFTDSDGTPLKFNILEFQMQPYTDSSNAPDTGPPWKYGTLFEGLDTCPIMPTDTVAITGTPTSGDTINLVFTNSNSSANGGLGTASPYTLSYPVADTTLESIAANVASAINHDATLRAIGISATNFNATSGDMGSTVQIIINPLVSTTIANQTALAASVTPVGATAGETLTVGRPKFSQTGGATLCDMRGLGTADTYGNPSDDWWNPPDQQTLDCSLSSTNALYLQ
jgi:hypothetical protein